VQAFIRAYPQITVELEGSQTVRDLIKEDFDLAIRVGNNVADGLNRRTIGRARFVLAGSVKWATKAARSPSPSVINQHRVSESPLSIEEGSCLHRPCGRPATTRRARVLGAGAWAE
jgi:DNA-binding transcriptional LysR family regulator